MPSETSSTAWGSTISRQAVSPPTPPGWPSRSWRITWPAGQRASVWGSNFTTKTLRRRFFSIAGASPTPHAASPCICPSAGPGKPSSVAPWPDCAPFPCQPDGAPSAPDPSTGQPLGCPANSCQPSPPVPLPACRRAVFAGRRHTWTGVATAHYPQPHRSGPGPARSPSRTHSPVSTPPPYPFGGFGLSLVPDRDPSAVIARP